MAITRRRFLTGTGALALGALTCTRSRPPAAPAAVAIPYVDGLSFLPADEATFAAAHLAAGVFDVSDGALVTHPDGRTVYTRTFAGCLAGLAAARTRLATMSRAVLIERGAQLPDALLARKTGVVLQIQGGGEAVGDDLTRLDALHAAGLRVFQLTHHFDNPLAGGALVRTPTGLTARGVEAVARCAARGILIDLSHASELTAGDVLRVRRGPVILSHGAARALVDNPRCTSDAVLRGIGETGGVIGVFMLSFWLTTDPTPTVDHYVRQIRHVANVAGVAAVGVANDFPLAGEAALAALGNDNARGVAAYHPWWSSIAAAGVPGFDQPPAHVVIPALNGPARLPRIHRALAAAGFRANDVARIMGGNWLRVLGTIG